MSNNEVLAKAREVYVVRIRSWSALRNLRASLCFGEIP